MPDIGNAPRAEQVFYDDLEIKGSRTHYLLHRLSIGFYEKGPRGRLWGPFWKNVDVRGAVALDYGCGDGSFSHLLAGRGAHVSGVDISPERIRQAEAATVAGNSGSAKFFVSDVHQTPFPDNSFDYVVGNGALHHLDLDRAYAEIARVLKPAGRAFFMEPMYRHPGLRLVRRLTPSLRSPCEKPLDFSDMERAKRWFRKVSHREHFLFAACTAPAALLGRATALTMINLVDRFDHGLMRLAPPLRELAWLTMLEMEK